MLINQTGTALYLDKDGNVVEEGPAVASLLVAPGGSLEESVAAKYGVVDRLTPSHEVDLANPVTGEPIVLVGGRAIARRLVDGPDNDARPRVLSKAVRRPEEDKSLAGPAIEPDVAAPAASPKSASLSQPPKGGDPGK